jgi:hypothetical protein
MSTVTKPPNSICRLCSGNAKLKLSHIFPRFAVKYLKESSSTGYLRGLASGRRVQETRRLNLLCESCEQLLSNDERVFCEQIFIPLHKQNKGSFDYDKWLIRFLVGLHWKVLVAKDTNDKYPDQAEAAYAKSNLSGEHSCSIRDPTTEAVSSICFSRTWLRTRVLPYRQDELVHGKGSRRHPYFQQSWTIWKLCKIATSNELRFHHSS